MVGEQHTCTWNVENSLSVGCSAIRTQSFEANEKVKNNNLNNFMYNDILIYLGLGMIIIYSNVCLYYVYHLQKRSSLHCWDYSRVTCPSRGGGGVPLGPLPLAQSFLPFLALVVEHDFCCIYLLPNVSWRNNCDCKLEFIISVLFSIPCDSGQNIEVQGRKGSILINEWSSFFREGQLWTGLCFILNLLHPISYCNYSNPGIQSCTMLKT